MIQDGLQECCYQGCSSSCAVNALFLFWDAPFLVVGISWVGSSTVLFVFRTSARCFFVLGAVKIVHVTAVSVIPLILLTNSLRRCNSLCDVPSRGLAFDDLPRWSATAGYFGTTSGKRSFLMNGKSRTVKWQCVKRAGSATGL